MAVVIKNKLQMRTSTIKKICILAGMLLVFIIMEILIGIPGAISSQFKGLLVQICYNIILAVSLNLTVGILGELSLGHAGFMCVGAFVGAVVSKCITVFSPGIPDIFKLLLAFILGGIFAALFGLVIGVAVLRLHGDYLAIVTLAFGEIIWKLLQAVIIITDSSGIHISLGSSITGLDEQAREIAGGNRGISGFGRINGDQYGFAIAFILAFITVWLVLNLIHSRTGRAVKAIRDNSIAAESVGINIKKLKLIIIIISAFFAGIAGVLYAHFNGQFYATQQDYGYIMSINILVFVVLGGMSSTLGSMLAAIVLTILPEMLRFLNDYRLLIYALVLICMMLFRSNPTLMGFVSKIKNEIKGLFIRKKGRVHND